MRLLTSDVLRVDRCSASLRSDDNSPILAGVDVVLSGFPSSSRSASASVFFIVLGGPSRYSFDSRALNNDSIKETVFSCRKTSICCSILSFSSGSGLSFLIKATTYFDKALGSASQLKRLNVVSKHVIQIFFYNFSREIEIGQINVNKSDNFSREIEVGQINENKSDNFSREIEIGQINVNKSDNFSREIEVLGTYSGSNTAASQAINASLFSIIILI